ncbi:hypothetical protein ACQ5SO_13050 [Rhodovulum sp. DZ06]|uniref:hypothetical protein n=1 Tax=Rhodovulum sp. DZ06 TaxID=3425126 RepID=UPI003D32E355
MSDHEAPAIPAGDVWTWADFEPGLALNTVSVTLDRAKLDLWEEVYGPGPSYGLPRGLLVSAMVEAFIKSGQPRPAGNIHASQELAFEGPAPKLGDVLTVKAACAGKEIRKDRKWVTIRTEGRIDGEIVCRGDFLIIWKL